MSNSSLLEQAIVDAQALRDAAFKSAQNALLEKYAPQIKEAVEKLLEQDTTDPTAAMSPEEAAAGATEMGADDAGLAAVMDTGAPEGMGKATVAGTAKEIPLAATDGEKLCPCPDEGEEIEINFDELQKQLAAKEEEPEEHEELAADMGGDQSEEEAVTGNAPTGPQPMMEKIDEELTLSEADLVGFLEEEMVDEEVEEELSPGQKKIAMAHDNPPPGPEGDEKIDAKDLAALRAKKPTVHEETLHESKTRELLTASAELIKEHKSLRSALQKKEVLAEKLLEENNKFKSIIQEMSDSIEKLEEVNLMNARLFYTNQVLKSASLNERQKNKIADAISKADSVNEAKAVYETLIDSVGVSPDTEKSPKSLNEMLTKSSSFRLPHKNTENKGVAPEKERLLKLAGIK